VALAAVVPTTSAKPAPGLQEGLRAGNAGQGERCARWCRSAPWQAATSVADRVRRPAWCWCCCPGRGGVVVVLALMAPVVLLVLVVKLLPLAAGLARLPRMQTRATQISSNSQISGRAMGQAVRIRASRAGTPSGRSS
jgi:hypothetical protein